MSGIRRKFSVFALAGLLCASTALARPADFAPVVADSKRLEANRKLDESRMPAEVLDFMGIRRGATVVDYYAGNGYYSELFSRLVGRQGLVYALNPTSFHDPKPWESILPNRPNIRVMVAPPEALQLAPASIDVLFNHLSYHDLYWESAQFKYPRIDVPPILAAWFRAVRPGGHVVIVDHVGPAGDPREVVERLHRIDPERIKADMAAAGFVLEAESSVLRRPSDDLAKGVFDKSVRGKTDRVVLKFRRP